MTILLGHAGSHKVEIDLDLLLRTRLLVQGNSGAGKSWLLRRLGEQLFGKIPVILIDPEGEFATLRERFGYVLVGKGGETPADPRSAVLVAQKLLELRASAVCDLYELKPATRHEWVRRFLEALIDAPKRLWHPLIAIVDEAHVYCPEKGAGESEASGAMIDLATRGRKRGFCAVFATQRLGKLRKDAASELLNVLVGSTFIDVDRDRAADVLGIPRADKPEFFDSIRLLKPGLFWALGRAISTQRMLVKVGGVLTSHPEPGSTKHAAEPPPAPERVKALLPKLADLPKQAEERARTEAELRAEIRSLKFQLSSRPTQTVERERVKEKRVEVLKDGQLQRLEKAVEKAKKVQEALIGMFLGGSLKALEEAKVGLQQHLGQIGIVADRFKAGAREADVSRAQRGADGVSVPRRPVEAKVAWLARLPASLPPADLPPAKQRILNALAFLEGIGVAEADKTQLALLADARPTSGAYFNNLGALRSAALIDYPRARLVSLTQAGRAASSTDHIPTTTAELHDTIRRRLSPAKWKIVEELIACYPNTIAKDELAVLAGARATSGAYFNNLGSLRSLGLIDYPSPGHVVARPLLFLDNDRKR